MKRSTRAAASACVPVLMTAALAALGLVPAAMSHAIGSEVQRPIAVVIVGGTVSACALTLIVLPVMYRLWAGIVERLSVHRFVPRRAVRMLPRRRAAG